MRNTVRLASLGQELSHAPCARIVRRIGTRLFDDDRSAGGHDDERGRCGRGGRRSVCGAAPGAGGEPLHRRHQSGNRDPHSAGAEMATPNLNLVYSSSAGGAGPYGEGWSLAVGSIERSGKWGVPRCMVSDGFDATDEFVLSLNGSAIELVTYGAGPNGSTAYRSRTDQSFLEAFRRTDNSWEVFDRSGMRYQFGTTAESRRTRTGGCGFTSIWGLTQMKDPNNNVVDVAYRTGENTLSLDTVQYGGTPS